MIRYHRSLNHKLCRQGIGGVSFRLHQHLMRNQKFLGRGFFTMIRIVFDDLLRPGTLLGPVRDMLIFVCFANFVCQFFQIRVISPEDLPGRLADNISVL